jgi:hypothetical protein
MELSASVLENFIWKMTRTLNVVRSFEEFN